jgi:zinc transport system ATP-binding protein
MPEKAMLISCQNVSFGYEGKPVIRDLSFTVESGDYLWVVGENGSGKTTLIKGILRLITPLEGSILFCNEISGGRIGYLSQQSAPKKDFPAGVNEIVLSGNMGGMGLRPFYNPKERKLADEAMKRLGIETLKKKCYRELSGGQQRRVLLARALVSARAGETSETTVSPETDISAEAIVSGNSRQLLVLDEPAASLDPLVTTEVYELLKSLNEQTGITIIMVSHDTRAAAQYANRILHIEDGLGFFSDTAGYLRSDRGKKFFSHVKTEVSET